MNIGVRNARYIGGIRRMELQIFNNNEFGQIRSLMLDDEVWFIGKDITLALGYSNDRKALQDNVDLEANCDGEYRDHERKIRVYSKDGVMMYDEKIF